MDLGTLAGLTIGVTVVLVAILTESSIWIFLNVPGMLIVFGGTFAATLVRFPLSGEFVAFPEGIKAAFTNDKDSPRDYIELAIKICKRARKSGLPSIENIRVRNEFFKKGIQMCADGREIDYIRNVLTQEMAMSIQRKDMGERVFNSIGDSAPAFSMFGTLVGLVQMLSTMNDPTSIGRAMAIALLTTLYGVLIANLVALPISDKLKTKSLAERQMRSLVIECVFQIQQMQNPTSMREILEPHLPEKQRGAGSKDGYTTRGKKEK